MIPKIDTKKIILDISEDLIMSRGYNGFSYNDISEIIGIKKASIHYHFKTKSDLASALLIRYHDKLLKWCENQNGKSFIQKIEAYGNLYKFLSAKGTKICPIEMLSAEYPTLSKKMQKQIQTIINSEKEWLTNAIETALKKNELIHKINPSMVAQIIQISMAGILKNIRIFKKQSLIDDLINEFKKIILK